jgi:hypothetical protein
MLSDRVAHSRGTRVARAPGHAEDPCLPVDVRGWRVVGERLGLRQREQRGSDGSPARRLAHLDDRWRTDRRSPRTDGGYGCKRRFGANGWRPRCRRSNREWRRLADRRRDGDRRSREHGWRNGARRSFVGRRNGNGRHHCERRSRYNGGKRRRGCHGGQRRRGVTGNVSRHAADRGRTMQRPSALFLRRLPQRQSHARYLQQQCVDRRGGDVLRRAVHGVSVGDELPCGYLLPSERGRRPLRAMRAVHVRNWPSDGRLHPQLPRDLQPRSGPHGDLQHMPAGGMSVARSPCHLRASAGDAARRRALLSPSRAQSRRRRLGSSCRGATALTSRDRLVWWRTLERARCASSAS